jgi:hypothetical protein
MGDTNFLAGQSSIWVQPDGPNSEPKYLGCHGVGDVTEPFGDITLLFCPDPAKVGEYMVKNSFTGEPGAVTTTIETDLRKTSDYLEDVGRCPIPIYIHKVSCGRRDVFTNFDRSFILRQSKITSRGLGALASRAPSNEAESTQTFDVSARFLTRIFNLEAARLAVLETEDITGLAVCGEDRCEGDCGNAQSVGDVVYASSKALVGSAKNTSDVLVALNNGAFTSTTSDPFAGGEDIQGVVCFKIGRDTTRVIVARGTTDAGNPAEIAYTDDGGATWTNVNVGSVVGEYVSNSHALFALDRYHVWVGTSGGRIYFSSDAGVTWTLQENAAISATAITGISFSDPLRGFCVFTGGAVGATVDGTSWGATTVSGATGATDIHAISAYVVWVSGSNGLWYTKDGGDTWTVRVNYAIGAIDFLDELFGMAVGSAASGVIYMTINGGYDWQTLPTIANSGMLDVTIINTKLAYICGKINSATGFIAKVVPQA